MSETQIERRRVLTFGAAALGVWSVSGRSPIRTLQAQEPGVPPDEGLLYFAVNIPGLPEVSRNIREIAIDELNIDAREMTTGLDVDVRRIAPGSVHAGSATFTSSATLGSSKELQAWFDEAATGKGIRKNITVSLFKSDRVTGRVYNLVDCFPTSYSGGNYDTSSTVQSETLTVKIGRIEFKT